MKGNASYRSVTGLVSRGLVNEEKGMNKGDPYYQGNTASMHEVMLLCKTQHLNRLV